ncbi:hypothetical protein ARMSODRAFT_973358 [Armillaria solidipes]|uniref:CCHC-type domain-containing protein n=1 Tax=Armillaria solidipes TaxID=1076256 RepID=A0A2H3BQ59_9AGAR|nr:hypothetical protein ARMSODRAFT_973358 [Armillaria solidipes]
MSPIPSCSWTPLHTKYDSMANIMAPDTAGYTGQGDADQAGGSKPPPTDPPRNGKSWRKNSDPTTCMSTTTTSPTRGRPQRTDPPHPQSPMRDDCWENGLIDGRPNPIPNPIGYAPEDAAFLGVKPVMIRPPHLFKGDHNDIEQFVGDCLSYFEVFAPYFTLPSLMTTFAASYLEGSAKDWWVYQCAVFWEASDWDDKPAQFRLLNFEEFVGLLTAQYRDPTIEEVHEKKMFELWMGNGTATTYFQELEKLAKLASRRGRTGSSGYNVPQTYMQWKACIIAMHEECQKKWAFDQVTSGGTCEPRTFPKGSSNTATSPNKTGGTTSSMPARPMSNAAPCDAASGKWTTYAGRGEPMDISALRREGRCFRCKKKGHLGKDCLEKKDYKDIRSVYTAEQVKTEEKEELKVEEDLSTVLESQNQYATLTVEECNDNNNDMALKGSTNGSPARAQAKVVNPAGHGAESPTDASNFEANCLTSSSRWETR